MLQFTSGVNDVELSLELAGTALHVATGHYYDLYGAAYEASSGPRHAGLLRPGGALVMKVYEVCVCVCLRVCLVCPCKCAVPEVPLFPCHCFAQGAGTQEFVRLMQNYFSKVVRLRVEASRSMSREFYAIGLGRKPPPKSGSGGG
jgi:23S rRNA (uridine2552-2'-O)-methyltransferase